MDPPRKKLLALAALYILAVLYGASYQQFRFFNPDDPRGLPDTRDYLALARGDLCSVPETRRYRPIVPFAAAAVRAGLTHFPAVKAAQSRYGADNDLYLVSFYLVNAAVTAAAAFIFFLFLGRLGFNAYLSLLGVTMFLTSRVTVMAAATPQVDSVYFLALAVIAYLCLADRLILLALLAPLLLLAKETVFPLLLLPFFKRSRVAVLALSVVGSVAAVMLMRGWVSAQCPVSGAAAAGLGEVVRLHLTRGVHALLHPHLMGFLSDLQTGFSLLLILAAIGFVLDRRTVRHRIPAYLLLLVPLALIYAFLSGGAGRMFFTAYPIVIPYALVALEEALGERL